MGAKSVDWMLYFIVIIFIVIFIIILYSLIYPYIYLTPCINEEKKKVIDLIEKYFDEIYLYNNPSVSKKVTFSSCVDWVFSPCNESGICMRFKNGEVYCLNEYSSIKIKVVKSYGDVKGILTLFFNTRGIIDVSKGSTYYFDMCNGVIESNSINLYKKEEVSGHIIDSIKIECGYSNEDEIFSNIDTKKYCR